MTEKGKKVEKSGLWEKIIKKHPGLKKMYPKGFDVYLAGEERRENPQRGPGDIESWPVGETGPHGFPHPSGSNPERPAFEIYSDELWNDPVQLESAVFLDSLHQIPYESEYAPLMNQFRGSFDKSQAANIRLMASEHGIDMNNDRQFRSFIDRVVIPMFLRGGLNELPSGQLDDRSGFAKSFRHHDPQAQPSPFKVGDGYRGDKLYNESQRDIVNKIRKMVTPVSGYRDR